MSHNDDAFDPARDTTRVAAAASTLAKTLRDGDSATAAGMLAAALRWGRYDDASPDWRSLREMLAEAAKRGTGGIEEHAFGSLARAALAMPARGDQPPGGLSAQIEDVEDLARILRERPRALPRLSREGRLADRLQQLADSFAPLSETADANPRDLVGLRWIARWTARLARAARGIEEANGGANSVGILLDAIGPEEPVPSGALDAPGVPEAIGELRASIIQWLRSSRSVEVIDPRPFVDRAQGEFHDIEHEETDGAEDGLVLRSIRLGWRAGGRVERRAAVVAARSRPAMDRSVVVEPRLAEEQRARTP